MQDQIGKCVLSTCFLDFRFRSGLGFIRCLDQDSLDEVLRARNHQASSDCTLASSFLCIYWTPSPTTFHTARWPTQPLLPRPNSMWRRNSSHSWRSLNISHQIFSDLFYPVLSIALRRRDCRLDDRLPVGIYPRAPHLANTLLVLSKELINWKGNSITSLYDYPW